MWCATRSRKEVQPCRSHRRSRKTWWMIQVAAEGRCDWDGAFIDGWEKKALRVWEDGCTIFECVVVDLGMTLYVTLLVVPSFDWAWVGHGVKLDILKNLQINQRAENYPQPVYHNEEKMTFEVLHEGWGEMNEGFLGMPHRKSWRFRIWRESCPLEGGIKRFEKKLRNKGTSWSSWSHDHMQT